MGLLGFLRTGAGTETVKCIGKHNDDDLSHNPSIDVGYVILVHISLLEIEHFLTKYLLKLFHWLKLCFKRMDHDQV